jgi:hypothetical protein
VALTVVVQDNKTHTVSLPFKNGALAARPGAPARFLASGLHNGTYIITVDHQQHAQLIVGAQPGP